MLRVFSFFFFFSVLVFGLIEFSVLLSFLPHPPNPQSSLLGHKKPNIAEL